MATTNGTPTLVSHLFIVDFYILSKSSGDDGDFDPALIYFYPPRTLTDVQNLEIGQIIGLTHFLTELSSSHPTVFDYKNSIVTSVSYGRHAIFLVLNSERFTAEESRIHLQRILNLFHFLFGTFNEIHTAITEAKNIEEYLKKTLTPIADYVFNMNRSIPNLFSSIKYLPMTRLMRPISLDAKHLIEHVKSKFDVRDGLIAYDNRILYTTFDNDTTYLLQAMLRISNKLPKDVIRHSMGKDVELHNGISLFRVFCLLSPSRLSHTTIASEPPSPNVTPSPMPFKPSGAIFIPRVRTKTNLMSDSFASPFASESESQSRSHRIFRGDSPAISSSETGFDTDQHDGDRSSPIQRIQRQNAVSNPIRLNAKGNLLSTDNEYGDERGSISPSPLSSPMNQESDLSDVDQGDSLSHPSRLNFSEIKNDEDESGYDDQPLAYRPSYHNGFDDHRSRSGTMTNGIRPTFRPRKIVTATSDRNNEHERNATILYVQKNSRMTVVYRLGTITPSEDHLKKLWFTTMQKLPELDGEIYTTCNFDEAEKQHSRVKFHYLDETRAIRFDRLKQNNRLYRPSVTPETVALALAARTKSNEEKNRRMIGFARGNHSLSVDYRSKTRSTFICQQQPKI